MLVLKLNHISKRGPGMKLVTGVVLKQCDLPVYHGPNSPKGSHAIARPQSRDMGCLFPAHIQRNNNVIVTSRVCWVVSSLIYAVMALLCEISLYNRLRYIDGLFVLMRFIMLIIYDCMRQCH